MCAGKWMESAGCLVPYYLRHARDAQRMAVGVHEALAQVIAAHSNEDPHEMLAQFAREHRYIRDVWSLRKSSIV